MPPFAATPDSNFDAFMSQRESQEPCALERVKLIYIFFQTNSVYISCKGQIKLSDYGFTHKLNDLCKNVMGDDIYPSSTIYPFCGAGKKMDIYKLVCINHDMSSIISWLL